MVAPTFISKLTHTISLLPLSPSHPQPYTYNRKLDVCTVAERDLIMGDLAANPRFRSSSFLPPSLPSSSLHSKLDVFTVAERDLFMGDLAANPQFRMSIPPPSTDTLVLVAGPEYFTTKAVDYLTKSGYVEDVIVTL